LRVPASSSAIGEGRTGLLQIRGGLGQTGVTLGKAPVALTRQGLDRRLVRRGRLLRLGLLAGHGLLVPGDGLRLLGEGALALAQRGPALFELGGGGGELLAGAAQPGL
jgi:hypothetical protein